MVLQENINKREKIRGNIRREERGGEAEIRCYHTHTGKVTSELCCQQGA